MSEETHAQIMTRKSAALMAQVREQLPAIVQEARGMAFDVDAPVETMNTPDVSDADKTAIRDWFRGLA